LSVNAELKFAIQVCCNPHTKQSAVAAYRYTEALLRRQFQVSRVFFYKDGVYHAFRYTSPPQDEINLTVKWSELALTYSLDLVVCISAAQRRGLLIGDEAKRQGKQDDDVAQGFRVGGLGQLTEALLSADRFIDFG
jgi:tRNA 2-thiouridine synthesizing protein D